MLATLALATALMQQASAPEAAAASATVYVYRYNQFVGKGVRPSVYCDEKELARMQAGRQFAVAVSPGPHVFRSNDEQAVIAIDAKAGETYYLRVEIATGFAKAHGRLVLTAPEQGRQEIQRLDPSDRDMVRDYVRVRTGPVTVAPTVAPTTTRLGELPAALTNDNVVELTKAGLSDSAIVAKIQTSKTAFKVDVDDLVALKKAGVSSAVIEAMLVARK